MINMIKIMGVSIAMSSLKCKLAVLNDVNAGDDMRLKYHEDFVKVVEAAISHSPKPPEVKND